MVFPLIILKHGIGILMRKQGKFSGLSKQNLSLKWKDQLEEQGTRRAVGLGKAILFSDKE